MYRNATDLYRCIWYPTALVNLISSNRFLVAFRIFYVIEYYLQTETGLLVPFWVECFLFLFLVKLLWTGLLAWWWIGVGTVGTLIFVTDLIRKSFKLSPLSMMLAVYLAFMVFIILRHIPSIPGFGSTFINVGYLICEMLFYIYWDDHMLIFYFINTFIDLCMWNCPCIQGFTPLDNGI